jgi:hypothetical protein
MHRNYQFSNPSSKKSVFSPSRKAFKDLSPISKDAPLRSSTGDARVKSSANPTRSSTRSTWYIEPENWSRVPLAFTTSFNEVLEFFHLSSLENASSEEAIFPNILYCNLFTQARLLAAILPWSVERPMQALLAMLSKSSRNYSARSAKRKPLSGAKVSSRKRFAPKNFRIQIQPLPTTPVFTLT